jgi:diguanylate cyclase (GGDEF)-like protein/PAS domain S-box-containing protein
MTKKSVNPAPSNESVRLDLHDDSERLKLVIEATGVGIWDWQVQAGILTANDRWAEIIGYTIAELEPLSFDTWANNLHPEDLTQAKDLLEKHWRGESELYQFEARMKHKEGHYVWVFASGKTVEWEESGEPRRMLGTHLDITQRKKDHHQFIMASQLLHESQEIARVGGWELNLETGELYWTDETYRLHDTTPEEFNPTVDAGVGYFLPESRVIISDALNKAVNEGVGYDLELETLTTKGRKIDIRTTCNVTQINGVPVRLTGIFQDISEQKEVQRKLESSNRDLKQANSALQLSAHFDPLTELPNRNLLADRMQQAIVKCARGKRSIAIAFIDLDGFKAINDSYGHSFGDELLRKVATNLYNVLRQGDTLARIGGDEFVAIVSDFETPEDASRPLNRMLEAIARTVDVYGKLLKVSASIGVTFYPQDNTNPDQLLRHADQAMYAAKQLGKNRYHIFDIAHDAAIKSKQEELERLKKALINNEFILYYQPKIDLRSKQVVGLEALIRWNHPDQGILPPNTFLPVIEQDILGIELGEWVIKEAIRQLQTLQAATSSLPISVNISPFQLQHADFGERLGEIIAQNPSFKANSLELEILESSALRDIEQVSRIIKSCNKLGVTFSIDDFGTGYSSLTYLKRLPAEYLKIDQSFVRDMLSDKEDLAIVQGIIELAKAFNLKVIAEGVETPAHGDKLLALGCYFAQGYGIAKPMPASDVIPWLAHWSENAELIDATL